MRRIISLIAGGIIAILAAALIYIVYIVWGIVACVRGISKVMRRNT